MPQSVLILGAGELGLAVLEALHKHPDRASISRLAVVIRQASIDSADAAKQQANAHIRLLGAELLGADVSTASASELSSVLAGFDTVVCCTGMGLPSGTQEKIARAVLAAGVRRYFPWQFGMDYDVIGAGSSQDLFDEQLAVRALLRENSSDGKGGEGKTRWTIVSTGVFMSFLVEPAFGIVDLAGRTVHALGSWDTRITATTPADIGTVTADVVVRDDPEDDGVVYTAGDTVSYAELADKVDARFGGSPFTRVLWDGPALAQQLRDSPGDAIVKYRDTFAQGVGVAWDVQRTVNHKRGIPMCNVETYLASLPA